MTLSIGQVLSDRYRIDALLGQGGMGAVYRAYDVRLQQAVAIKENTMAVPGISAEAIEASRRQFEREALVLASLRHPNLPRVTDHFVMPDGNQYLVMDFIAGDDLENIVARVGPLPVAQAIAWISQACSALEHLHSRQPSIIHRDIKPQNIKVTPQGEVFLVDFGIAKVGEASRTTMGALGVTPGFSPPEQYGAGGTDARSDIYALGATLYALLTGHTPPESMMLIAEGKQLTRPSTLRVGLTPQIEQAILTAMEPRKTGRPQSVAEFRRMLAEHRGESVEHVELPPTRLMGAAGETADKQVPVPPPSAPAMPQSKPAPAPIAQPRRVAPAPTRSEHNLLPLLWAGAGIAALVLIMLVIMAIWKLSEATPVPPTKAPTPTKATATTGSVAAATRISEKDGMVMVYVPDGEFLMGSADSDPQAKPDEKPQHNVYLDAFWIDRTEVTNAQHKKCVQAGLCQASSYASDSRFNGDNQPVVGVDWYQAKEYCLWVWRQLPTEAEWEKAARGTDNRIYPWGNQAATCEYAVMDDGSGNGCGKGSAAWVVGSKPKGASPYGALDMAGNVWEWVFDWYDGRYYLTFSAKDPSKNPGGPSSGQYRVLRGGGWLNYQSFVRMAHRSSASLPDSRSDSVGFRCVLPGD